MDLQRRISEFRPFPTVRIPWTHDVLNPVKIAAWRRLDRQFAQIGHQATLQRYFLDVHAWRIGQDLPKLLPNGYALVVNQDVVSAEAPAFVATIVSQSHVKTARTRSLTVFMLDGKQVRHAAKIDIVCRSIYRSGSLDDMSTPRAISSFNSSRCFS